MMTTLAGLVVVLMMIVKEIANLFDAVKTLFQFKISQRRMIKMEIFQIIGLALVATVIALLLKAHRPEMALQISLVTE